MHCTDSTDPSSLLAGINWDIFVCALTEYFTCVLKWQDQMKNSLLIQWSVNKKKLFYWKCYHLIFVTNRDGWAVRTLSAVIVGHWLIVVILQTSYCFNGVSI